MCGIIAVINNKRIDKDKFMTLLCRLQHRGQESFGISFLQNNNKIITNSYLGKIKDNDIPFFYSKFIIGHNRYSTSGKSKVNHRIKELSYNDSNTSLDSSNTSLNNSNTSLDSNIDSNIDNKNDTYFEVLGNTDSSSISSLDSLNNNNQQNTADNINNTNNIINNIINNKIINNNNNISDPIHQTIHNESQPFTGFHPILGQFTLVHNGNIPYNSDDKNIVKSGINTNLYNCYLDNNIDIISDTHMIVKFIENFDFNRYAYIYNKKQDWDINPTLTNDEKWKIIFIEILKIFKKAYCLIILTNSNIYALRDKYGVRPLCIGYNEFGWCISSESTVFNNEYNFMRDVKPGEILKVNEDGINTMYFYENDRKNILNIPIKAHCLFEYIYFLKEDTFADNFHVSNLRYKFGVELANQDIENEQTIKNAIVVGSPSTGIPSGKGYADKMNLPYIQVLKKDNNVGRTFILENNKKRDNACKKKYYLDTKKIKNNKIIIVDDSLVRGTTITNLISIFRESGAKEVHIRIAAPPIKNPCYYGIDIPTKEELIANNNSVEEIQKIINANSLSYLSMNSIRKIMENHFGNMCTGCFDGHYNNYDW